MTNHGQTVTLAARLPYKQLCCTCHGQPADLLLCTCDCRWCQPWRTPAYRRWQPTHNTPACCSSCM